jgi:hypothetical protein
VPAIPFVRPQTSPESLASVSVYYGNASFLYLTRSSGGGKLRPAAPNQVPHRMALTAGEPAPDFLFLELADGHESTHRLFRSRSASPLRRSASTAACFFFQIGTARASALRPLAVSFIRRPRRSTGSAMIRTSPRRRKGLRAAVNVVRSIASSDATAFIPGGSGRFRDTMSENCPLVSPTGRSASSKRRASARAVRCTCRQRQQSRIRCVVFKVVVAEGAINK